MMPRGLPSISFACRRSNLSYCDPRAVISLDAPCKGTPDHPRVFRRSVDSIMRAFRKAACVTSIALSACTPAPTPQIVTKIVDVPVPVACVDKSLIPAEPEAVTLPLSDARLAADIAASQALKYHAWGRELFALIGPCTK